jgi:hypothetical protein
MAAITLAHFSDGTVCGCKWQPSKLYQASNASSHAINQSINVTPVAMKLKKLMPAIH